MMTAFPLMKCCEMLSIDPKTLRNWLRQAHMPLHLHPTDARIKCLTMEQVQGLAALHGRVLKPNMPFLPESPEPLAPQKAKPMAQREWESASVQGHKESLPLQEETLWLKQIADLEAQVASLQHHLAHLRSLAAPGTLSGPVQQVVEQGDVQADRNMVSVEGTTEGGRQRAWTPHPAESRRRPVLPLIASGAAGTYVVICPWQGELELEPDSAQWFAWLASLSSFRFVGRSGRMSVTRVRDHGPKRTWYAYRCIHQQTYKHYLGATDHLTIAVLEQMAARLQSYVDAF